MLKSLLFLLILSFPVSNSNSRKLFDEFQSAFKQRDFKKIDQIMSPNFIAIDENGHVAFHKADYFKMLKGWSVVFDTKWGVKSVVEKSDSIITIEDDTDMFDNYFWNGKIEFRYTYTINSSQLTSLRWDSLSGYTERKKIFDYRFNTFYQWIYQDHPDKITAINDFDSASSVELKTLLTEYINTHQ